jgi:hypothetical protein
MINRPPSSEGLFDSLVIPQLPAERLNLILLQESDQEQDKDYHQQHMDKISSAPPPASPPSKGANQPQQQQNDDERLKRHGISPFPQAETVFELMA